VIGVVAFLMELYFVSRLALSLPNNRVTKLTVNNVAKVKQDVNMSSDPCTPLTELKYQTFCLLECSRNCSAPTKAEVVFRRTFPSG
jgi:hypothetical protein